MSTFLTTNDLSKTNDLRFHHGLMTVNRTNENLPIILQSTTIKNTNKLIQRNNPRIKRNLRDKRRSTGIRSDDVSMASTSTDGSANEEGEGGDKSMTCTTESNELLDHNRTIPSSSSSTSVFTVSRIQSSFENLSIPSADSCLMTSNPKIFRSEEFLVRRKDKSIPDDDLSRENTRQLEERILDLETLLCDKDNIIQDLQRKLDNTTRDLTDAEQQIYSLHQDKLTLIKAFASVQDNKSSSEDLPRCSSFVARI